MFYHSGQERILCHLRKEFQSCPTLQFGSLFHCLAVKKGGAGEIHIDWHDDPRVPAVIFALGNWTGGSLRIPQLGVEVPIRPYQVFLVLARVVAHCTAPITEGERLVFVGFADRFLLKHTEEVTVIYG